MSNGMYDVYSCGFDGVIVRPKRVHKQIIFIFAKDFACHGSHENARESFASRWAGHFGVRFGSVWGQFGYRWMTLGHLMVTLQSLWIHLGYMKVLSQKTFIFPTYFNDFIREVAEF